MARGENQKLKLLYLAKIFMEETDEKHGVTTQELIDMLKKYEINAERKSIYTDLEELERFGFDIVTQKSGKITYHHLISRQFELPELKLLVDSVQAAKFITEKKSNELIKKLEAMVSRHEAKQLQRQVYISGRVKTMNESIYYNVDYIHTAIAENVKITFQYFNWNTDKKMEMRHGGKLYKVSPWGLIWDDENYYLVAFDGEAGKIKHYRVDKMYMISVTQEKREGKHIFEELNISKYNQKMFGMFDGKITHVGLEADNSLVGVLIDRFGKDIMIFKKENNCFTTYVDVAVSRHFLSWIISLGNGIKIISPPEVVSQMKEVLNDMNKLYE